MIQICLLNLTQSKHDEFFFSCKGLSGCLLVSLTGSDSAAVSVVTLVSSTGAELTSEEAAQQADGSFLVLFDEMPSVEFVVRVSGEDDSFPSVSSSVVFHRQSPTSFRTSDVKITVSMHQLKL